MSLLMAQSGHSVPAVRCPLLGEKRDRVFLAKRMADRTTIDGMRSQVTQRGGLVVNQVRSSFESQPLSACSVSNSYYKPPEVPAYGLSKCPDLHSLPNACDNLGMACPA